MATVYGRPSAAPDDSPGRVPLSSWYTQGPSDGLGDRLLMFDNASTGPLELLRVRPDFAFLPEFEARIRERLDRLAGFSHPGFAEARSINHFDNDEGLTVVSTHVAGTRLSELFPAARARAGMPPAVAHWVLGELMSALAALHRYPGVAHGALAPERIVITSDRHVVISDYIFGDALNALRLPSERLWNEFRVVPDPRINGTHLDQHADVVQAALIALSLVIGRRVGPDEYTGQRQRLLDDFSAAAQRQPAAFARGLRTWLDRALDPEGFRSAVEANRALIDLTGAPAIDEWSGRGRELPAVDRAIAPTPVPEPHRAAPIARIAADAVDTAEEDNPTRRLGSLYWMAAALAIIGIVQGAVIARLVFRSPVPTAAGSPASPVPESADRATSTVGNLPDSQVPLPPLATRPGAVMASSQGSGGPVVAAGGTVRAATLRIDSPLELEVSSGNRRVGSSRAAVALPAGTHELTFTNVALGVRTTQTVRLEPGRQTSLRVEPPQGSLNANAQPWAQVSIDGQVVGETPLANVAIAVGEHDVVFRHPQLGERRQHVTVRAGVLTRVSTAFTP